VGQKVHPYGFRIGFNKGWKSRWFGGRDYAKMLHEDVRLRRKLKKDFAAASVSKIEIERKGESITVFIHTAKPGQVIGKKGVEIEKLRNSLRTRYGREVKVEVEEINRPEVDAQLVAENIAGQLERRIAFRRAMKRSIEQAMRFGAQGIKVRVAGRLNGAEIARSEWYLVGRLPLHTLRSDIDYGFAQAYTTWGVIGVKVQLYKGESFAPESRDLTRA
jgi:small subunit ribosomal protein S3